MPNKLKSIIITIATVGIFTVFSAIFTACEDPVPKDYEKLTVIEALLVVGEPIQNIKITQTQPIYEAYNYDNSLVKNAKVFIAEEGSDEFELKYEYSEELGKSGYYYDNQNYLVKEKTKYNLRIILPDNSTVTGTTITPASFEWENAPKNYVQYPKDTINLSGFSDSISWTKPENSSFYILSVTCLDTENYGKYLETPTNQRNRRVHQRGFGGEEDTTSQGWRNYYSEMTAHSVMPNNKTPIVWNIFKWFGAHRVKIFNPDNNFRNWYFQIIMSDSFNDRFSSLTTENTDCMGFFGSAYIIQDTFCLLMNQP